MDVDQIAAHIRAVPDFPHPGILFRDITPLLFDTEAREAAIDGLAAEARTMSPTCVAGIESRGFIFGMAVAERLGLPFVLVRKAGKLPGAAAIASYALEYGEAQLELHRSPSLDGQRVLIVDDVIATGGTATAAATLVHEVGGTVAGFAFLIELVALAGRERLGPYPTAALVRY